jgi:predicted lipoprotein with Yx(FWY)xxD motif
MGRHRLVAASALPLIFVLAACSSGATPSPTSVTASQPPAASQPAASEPAASSTAGSTASSETGETYEVKVASGTVAGATASFLTGEDGKTLYIFTNDKAGDGKSACYDQCATNWPPFTVDDKSELKADSGVTGTLDVLTRTDGTLQVTYKGAPLYYYAADTAAGDTKGEGVAGKWHVAAP